MKVGRNDPCPCGKLKSDGNPMKYKHCCLIRNEQENPKILKKQPMQVRFSRRDLIHGPYKQCPNPKCLDPRSFGVFVVTGSSGGYSRECTRCGFSKGYAFPEIKKSIVYLDQFVISNLVKLLDRSHKSHEKIKADPFWKNLFIKLEGALKSQAIICPDSFYHRDESLAESKDFKLMKRLYEHFSNGKTLHMSHQIEQMQITEHFANWLSGQKTVFDFDPSKIVSEDLNDWSVGIRVGVNMRPFPGEVEKIKNLNFKTKEQLKSLWSVWQNKRDFEFLKQVKEETGGLWENLIGQAVKFEQRRGQLMAKVASGEKYDFELDDFLPPPSNSLLDELFRISKRQGIPEGKILVTIMRYFKDIETLLEIPKIRISSVMFASLARSANLGKKEAPKSLTDTGFISSYLPYCDAMFLDKESAIILRETPKGIPVKLRLKEFNTKIFSLKNKEEFLDYLDELKNGIPKEQINILKDVGGENYDKPFWSIIEHEKIEKD